MAFLVLAVVLASAHATRAQICTVTSSGLMFGTYDPFAPSPASITGTVTVTCQAAVALGLSYSVQLGPGSGGSFSSRVMAAGANRLGYQLYTNAARTVVWGDGTGGTGVVGESYLLLALASTPKTYTAYGTIPARQNVAPGSYSDVVSVLVTY